MGKSIRVKLRRVGLAGSLTLVAAGFGVFGVTGGSARGLTTAVSVPAMANAGATVNVSISYSNNGPSTADNVSYMLTLAASLSGVSFSGLPMGAMATYNSGDGTVTFAGMPLLRSRVAIEFTGNVAM